MKNPILNRFSYWHLVILFSLLKLLIHLLTNTHYELHRDAYLYYAQSEHLAWGFHSVPPFVSLIGKLSTVLFGNTTFGLRFFPAVVGALNLFVIGAFIKELGGNKRAFFLAALAFVFSPMYLHVNTLFQPVAFNQFFWLLISYLMFRLIKNSNTKQWLWLGLIVGVAFLNKYSVIFIVAAFFISLCISKHRQLIISKHFFIGLGLGLLIISPNIIWQYRNGFPVVLHMKELKETQLVHVNHMQFLIDQFLTHIQALPLILVAFWGIFSKKEGRTYKVFIYTFLLVIGLILLGSGKSYYTMGVYPMLYVFGAVYLARYVSKKYLNPVSILILVHTLVTLLVSFRFDGIPLRTPEQTYKEGAFTWEDGKKYPLPQDMADMTGWNELAVAVIDVYNEVKETEGIECAIFCHHYGQAGSIMFYGKDYGLPQPTCFNGSFTFWSPETIVEEYLIVVIHERDSYDEPEFDMTRFFESWELKYEVDNEFFRENGTRIYLAKNPNKEFANYYTTLRAETLKKYQR